MNTQYVFLFLNIILLVLGQCIWKVGIDKLDSFSIVDMFFSWYVWGGVVIYGIATFCWLKVLSMLPLSVAYPFQSLAYLFGIILAYFLFGETLSVWKVMGSLFIFIGVTMIAVLGE